MDTVCTSSAALESPLMVDAGAPEILALAEPCEGCGFKAEVDGQTEVNFELHQANSELRRENLELRRENLELRQQSGSWKSCYQRYRKKAEEFEQKIENLEAKIRKLERELFGAKSEKGSSSSGGKGKGSKGGRRRKRGQQAGNPGPDRRNTSHLPTEDEHCSLPEDECKCPICHLAYISLEHTEDSEVIEIDVKAYKRRIRRQCYKRGCECPEIPAMLAAPGPDKLIPKGLYGNSVWSTILLDKYCFLRPTNRLLEDLKTHGLDLAMGTITGGLKRLTPLFEPIMDEIVRQTLAEKQWHADETGWLVLVEVEGKDNYKWKLWVFMSASAVAFVLDPTKASRVPQAYFKDVEQGVLIVDRFSSYKAMQQVKDGVIRLAYCWVHVRRDFLAVAKDWPGQEAWGESWVKAIGNLFRLNRLRLRNWQTKSSILPRAKR